MDIKGMKPQDSLPYKGKNLPDFTSSLSLGKQYFLSARLENQMEMLSGRKSFLSMVKASGWSWVHSS